MIFPVSHNFFSYVKTVGFINIGLISTVVTAFTVTFFKMFVDRGKQSHVTSVMGRDKGQVHRVKLYTFSYFVEHL